MVAEALVQKNPFGGMFLLLLIVLGVIFGFGVILVNPVYQASIAEAQRAAHTAKHPEADLIRELIDTNSLKYCGEDNLMILDRVLPGGKMSRIFVCLYQNRLAVMVTRLVGDKFVEVTAFFLERPTQLSHLVLVRGYKVVAWGVMISEWLSSAFVQPELTKFVSKFLLLEYMIP